MDEKTNIQDLIQDIKRGLKPSKFDPYGSYTGMTEGNEKPIQDQDDL